MRDASCNATMAAASVMIPAPIGEPVVQEEEANAQSYELIENIAYRAEVEYSQPSCRLDVYYPEKCKNFATVVWFHGGGLQDGSRYVPNKLMEQGIAVVAAGYRLSAHVKAPAYIEDAAAAVAWVFENTGRYGGSRERIFVAGAYAG